MRFFNTTGPVVPADHYCIPPLGRLNFDEIRALVREKQYFVLHAPRQTGKTSVLLALRDRLNSGAEGDFRCVYANVEVGQAAREDVDGAMRAILYEMELRARATLRDDSLVDLWPGVLERAGPNGALRGVLARWCEADPRPLVLLVDEIDSLVGDTLPSVLRQLRAGYDERPEGFPHSVVLCGVRDVRDYRIHSGSEKAVVAGDSAFNVKARSLRLGDFSEGEVRVLLAQHTDETGQSFTPEALDLIWAQTRGQPWLVNALASEACFWSEEGRARARPIAMEDIFEAREQLVVRRETHLGQLADKLQEERVRRVIEPLLSGGEEGRFSARDIEYVRDLGIIARDAPLRIANPVYAEVVPRELTSAAQGGLVRRPLGTLALTAAWTLRSCSVPSRSSSGNTPSTGWRASTTRRPGRNCCYRRSCNGWRTGDGASSASMGWVVGARTCSSSGPRAAGIASSSSNAKWCARGSSPPSAKGCDRPWATWTVAWPSRGTSSFSIAEKAGAGRTRFFVATRPRMALRSRCGACEVSPAGKSSDLEFWDSLAEVDSLFF